ncbi:LPXTG cell wall anchor domain-containing protein [Saccharothrix coeruleofusca]|uniref:Gram-positive cocci surface proteins LPxTG domain-containing protein n=1 Tax=Saccharothrix coeruleofusca TaxID=33919 RepID=A0A918ANH8_9PSEU|nr:LPXTG cell wall anchor domain-containing protein [Saccharothrix coeruleofusca]MBP2337900.1 LPXTG-motif cell wall-anchored protein [Saccharothrix coeruleofusca]GGP63033.1 hypothetical protein GCM10010185_39460 [Saccharothrix coeruleofusca]
MQFARTVAASAGIAAAVAITGLFTGTASAHNKDLKAACVGEKTVLSVNLTQYSRQDNGLEITDNGQQIEKRTFRSDFKQSYTVAGDVAHTFVVKVKATDGDQYSFTKELKTPACVKPVPTTTTTTTTTAVTTTTTTAATTTTTTEELPPTTTTTESTPVESTTTTTEAAPTSTTTTVSPVPVANEDELASTGASVLVPLLIGGGLLGGGAALLIVMRRRASNS